MWVCFFLNVYKRLSQWPKCKFFWSSSAAHGIIRYNSLRLKCHRIAWHRFSQSYNDEFCGLAFSRDLFQIAKSFGGQKCADVLHLGVVINGATTLAIFFLWRWFITVDAGFTILRCRIQFLLPATRWICVGWSQRQLLHVLLYNQIVSLQLAGIFNKFLVLFTIFVSSFTVSTISTRVLNTIYGT